MGYRIGGKCYSTAGDALMAHYSGVAPVQSGDPVSLVVMEYRSNAWYQVEYVAGVEDAVYPAPSLALAPCDVSASAQDAAYIAFLIVSVWLVGWIVRVLRQRGLLGG